MHDRSGHIRRQARDTWRARQLCIGLPPYYRRHIISIDDYTPLSSHHPTHPSISGHGGNILHSDEGGHVHTDINNSRPNAGRQRLPHLTFPLQDGKQYCPYTSQTGKKDTITEMRELLPDNIALTERLAALPSGVAHTKPPSEREIGGDKALVTWVSSFATYIAIVAEAHPRRVSDMLAYMRLVVREAGKFGGSGWLTYDTIFRRNHEGLEQRWNYLDASLHQVYIASLGDKLVVLSKHCHEIDHVAADCAVAAVLPRSLYQSLAAQAPPPQNAGFQRKAACFLLALPPSTPNLHVVECRQLQVPGQVRLRTCVRQLLWEPPSLPLPGPQRPKRPEPEIAGLGGGPGHK